MTKAMAILLPRMIFARYLLASVCALACDFLVFLGMSRAGVWPMGAAAMGYCAGLLLHWLLSVRFVFLRDGDASPAQCAGFALSALVGLAVTTLLVGGFTALGLPPATARALAVPVSFLAVYAIRRYGVFARA